MMIPATTTSSSRVKYNSDLCKAVLNGLSAPSKYLSSKYFYDSTGDRLFQKIMALPEYYLTRSEEEILNDHKKDILQSLCREKDEFSIVELGAGDGKKTKVLLNYFRKCNSNFTYIPVDISEHAITTLTAALATEMPDLKVKGIAKEYVPALKELQGLNTRKLILFLGSSIGNFQKKEAGEFLKLVRAQMSDKDLLLVGFDLKKDPHLISKAYDDSEGVTRDFNFNLLIRLNEELGGNFDLNNFTHYPTYDPSTGEMKSFLLSTKKQSIYIDALQRSFEFAEWESIFTEVSMKYSKQELVDLAKSAGLKIDQFLLDSNKYYTDIIFSPETLA